MRNKLYIFEGADGCGKSTHMKMAAKAISEDNNVEICSWSSASRIEGVSPLETLIKNYSEDNVEKIRLLCSEGFYDEDFRLVFERAMSLEKTEKTLTLFALALAINDKYVVGPFMASGATVFCDRSFLTTMAYQGLADDMNIVKSGDMIKKVYEDIGQEILSGVFVYIYLDDETRISRLTKRSDQLDYLDRDTKLQGRLHASYLDVIENKYGFPINKVIMIENKDSIEEVQRKILRSVGASRDSGVSI